MSVASEHLDGAAQRAAAERWSDSHFLGYLLHGELEHRHRRTVETSLRFARFPYRKRLADFDFSAQPSLDRRLIDELATGRFMHEGRNIVLLGPPGVSKTHLALALGLTTCELGHRVYFTSAIDLAHKLTRAVDNNRLHREMKSLMQPKLLILDEVGYLQFDPVQASLLFQVICQRYQREQARSTLSWRTTRRSTEGGRVPNEGSRGAYVLRLTGRALETPANDEPDRVHLRDRWLRHRRTTGNGSRAACLAMVFNLAQSAEKRWRKLDGHQLIPDVNPRRSIHRRTHA